MYNSNVSNTMVAYFFLSGKQEMLADNSYLHSEMGPIFLPFCHFYNLVSAQTPPDEENREDTHFLKAITQKNHTAIPFPFH